MAETILVSVITVCYNSEKTIRKTIESVLSQTYINYEHIFVDGGSTDDTISIIKSYSDEYGDRLRLIQGKDRGIYDAMNKGINAAKGMIVGIINSDDWYAADALQNVVRVYQKNLNEMVVITGNLVRTTYEGNELYLQKHDKNSINTEKLTQGMPLQHPAVFVSLDTYKHIGTFDISYRYLADYDFVWRCYHSGKVKFDFTGTTTSYMREGGASDTFKYKNIRDRTMERYRLRKQYIGRGRAFTSSIYFLVSEIAKQIGKRLLPKGIKNFYYGLKHGDKKKSTNLQLQQKSGWRKGLQKINDFLRNFPTVRRKIILVIRYIQYLAATVKRIIKREPTGFIHKGKLLTPANENCYFGYYDKSPYSPDGKKLIYHSIPAMKAPLKGEHALIYLHDLNAGERKCVGKTLAWNLQQGAMLRYYQKNELAWNDYSNGDYCTVFYNLDTGEKSKIDYPLYDIDKKGKYGLSLDFERLNIDAEGYGYIQKGMTKFDSPAEIYLIDINNNSRITVIDSDSLNKKYPIPHDKVDFFYFNHLNFNPSGERFLFIERYVYEHKRYSRLFSSDLSGKNINLLADEMMVSHFTWITNEKIMVYCRHNGKDAYYLFDDMEGHKFESLDDPHLKVDGHPTFLVGSTNSFVSDTYPDGGRRRHLFTYNIAKEQYEELAALSAPIKYDGPVRCDLHPRLHPDGTRVCIDSIHEGHRGIYEVLIKE